jgi:hypothetical protein
VVLVLVEMLQQLVKLEETRELVLEAEAEERVQPEEQVVTADLAIV